jgi:FkbM family methyltransferase
MFKLLKATARAAVYNNPIAGMIVSAMGDVVNVNGLKFSTAHPSISLGLKGRFLFGAWEREEIQLVTQVIDPTLPLIELGGCIGVVSCIANRLLDDPTKQIVVEANPDLVPLLTANRDRNGCKFEIVPKAVAYGKPSISFHQHDLAVGGSVLRQTGKTVEVPTTTVEELSRGFDEDKPITLVIDIEGSELDVIANELDFIATRVKTLWIETHARFVGEPETARMLEQIRGAGFEETARLKIQHVFENPRFATVGKQEQVAAV